MSAGPDGLVGAMPILWLDSTFGTSPGSLDGALDSIKDRFPRRYLCTNVSPNRPAWSSNAFRGKPSVYFEVLGVSADYLQMGEKVRLRKGCTIFMSYAFDPSLPGSTVAVTAGNVPMTIVGDTDPNFCMAFGFNAGDVAYSYKSPASPFVETDSSALTLSDGNFHTVAVTHDGADGSVKLYADGLLVKTATRPFDSDYTGFDTIGMGNSLTDQWWGSMAELLVWDNALDNRVISKLHSRALGLWA